jgi:transcriptional regulator with XRE-family HTH domain
MNLITENLRKKRLEKGYQQKDMAYGLGISGAAYSKIESGKTKTSLEMAKKIASFLKIPLPELLEGQPSNIEIKNVTNSPFAIENSTLIIQNEKLIETQIKLSEQMISIMQSQNDLFREVMKSVKNK